MKLAKGETKPKSGTTVKVELELEKKLSEQLQVMETFTKIPRSEIVTTALLRFISAHKDYFPEDYKG
jgi:hypothetical protein